LFIETAEMLLSAMKPALVKGLHFNFSFADREIKIEQQHCFHALNRAPLPPSISPCFSGTGNIN